MESSKLSNSKLILHTKLHRGYTSPQEAVCSYTTLTSQVLIYPKPSMKSTKLKSTLSLYTNQVT